MELTVNATEQREDLNSPLALIRELLHSETTEQKQNAGAQIRQILGDFNPAETARILESLPPNEREELWKNLDKAQGGDVLAHLSESVLSELVNQTPINEILDIAENMDEDDLVDFLQDLPDHISYSLLASFDKVRRERLGKILKYDEDSAGGMMNTDPISVRADTTAEAVIRYLRRMEELPAITNKLFVIDRNGKLQGEVLLTKIITADFEATMQDLMKAQCVSLDANAPGSEVARVFREHDLVTVPVVNSEGQLIGRITSDDVMDYIQETNERLLMQTAGMDEDVDTFAPIKQAAFGRGIWLGINLMTALLSASVINAFGATIEKTVALAALAPIVASMAGNAGLQSLTLIIRGIALGQIQGANAKSLLIREMAISLIEGAVWGTITACVAAIWFKEVPLALIVFLAIATNLLFAAIAGICIPLLLKKLRIDPALAGSVILTAVTDAVGFFLLLGLATLIL